MNGTDDVRESEINLSLIIYEKREGFTTEIEAFALADLARN